MPQGCVAWLQFQLCSQLTRCCGAAETTHVLFARQLFLSPGCIATPPVVCLCVQLAVTQPAQKERGCLHTAQHQMCRCGLPPAAATDGISPIRCSPPQVGSTSDTHVQMAPVHSSVVGCPLHAACLCTCQGASGGVALHSASHARCCLSLCTAAGSRTQACTLARRARVCAGTHLWSGQAVAAACVGQICRPPIRLRQRHVRLNQPGSASGVIRQHTLGTHLRHASAT